MPSQLENQPTSNSDIDEPDTEASELHALAHSIVLECKQSRPYAILETAIFLLRQVLDQPHLSHLLRTNTLRHLFGALIARYNQWGWVEDAMEVGELLKTADFNIQTMIGSLQANYEGNIDNTEQTDNVQFAESLLTEFTDSVERSSIDTAICLYYQAFGSRSSNTDRMLTLVNLSEALVIRFYLTSEPDDLDRAISLLQQAVDLGNPTNPAWFWARLSLGMVFSLRLGRSGDCHHDSSSALSEFRRAFQEDVEANELIRAGVDRSNIFQQSGIQAMLDAAVDLYRKSLRLRPAPHPCRSYSLYSLGTALYNRFESRGQHADLEDAIAFMRESLDLRPAPHPSRSIPLTNLTAMLSTRFAWKGQPTDLDDIITLTREALDLTPAPNPDRCLALTNIAGALYSRFVQKGQQADLEEAIHLQREALDLTPAPHPNRYLSLINLAGMLSKRFEQNGQLTELEDAVVLLREALDVIPASHPRRSDILNNVSAFLSRRFEQKGQLSDLEEAIDFQREALKLRHVHHPDRHRSLINLANALDKRFEQKSLPNDLEEAIAIYREALDLTPTPHPDRFYSLTVLANILSKRFHHMHNLPDLKEAISLLREALDLTPTSHPDRSNSLHGLAVSLNQQFEQTGQLADLEESVALQRQSLDLLPINHPDRHQSINLGWALISLYSATQHPEHLQDAMNAFHNGAMCKTASLFHQFRSSKRWAMYADSYHHSSAADAFNHTIDLLPHLASLDMNLQARQEVLVQTRGLASDACSWAIRAGKLEKAVEFVSAARAVFWSQALQLRTPIDDLTSVAPDLAETLRAVSADLEAASQRDPGSRSFGSLSNPTRDTDEEAKQCRFLNEQRNLALERVRKLPGFEDFLLRKSFHQLQQAAHNGPVVILNASQSGCDGLLIDLCSVKHIPFPGLTLEDIHLLGEITRAAVSGTEIRSALCDSLGDMVKIYDQQSRKGIRVPDPGHAPEDLFRCVLAILWLEIASPVIQFLNLKISDSPSRIWWCPTGLFAFLPIHAAGIYDNEMLECLSDYVISSYTPTLEALFTPPSPSSPPESFAMLAVIEPETPGQPSLPSTRAELDAIQQHIPKEWLKNLGTKEAPSSVETVLASLPNTSFAHFACHGVQDLIDPLKSALLFRDGYLEISKIMEYPLPNATLAFLSACETAAGDESIPDEAIHIAATMLFAGFRGVVGTMWTILDEDAPEVADVFYRHLFRNGIDSYPDATEAAYALHLAVKELRVGKKLSFKRWVPFIHLGI